MSEGVILWLFGTVIGIQTLVLAGIVGAIWNHVNECKAFRATLAAAVAEIGTNMKRMQEDIGTHDSGMRGDIHQLRDFVTPYIIRSQMEREGKKDK